MTGTTCCFAWCCRVADRPAVAPLHGQVTSQRLAAAANEPQNWLTYSGNYSSTRYSPLDQITPANVRNLKLQWVYQSPVAGNWQTTPLVVDGIMYITQRLNDVVALDATHRPRVLDLSLHPGPDRIVCCGANNRGLAILGDTLFMGTLDAQLIAIDAKTGRADLEDRGGQHQVRLLDHARAARREGQGDRRRRRRRVRHPRLHRRLRRRRPARKRGASTRFRRPASQAHETWEACPPKSRRRFCDPEAWKHGGGSIWMTGSYDPQLNLTYWGVGNVGPDYNGAQRPGDNLYTASIVALDADTGKLRWHYQFTPHDVYDYDSVQVPVLDRQLGQHRHQRRRLGEPQRQLLRARSCDRTVPARQAVREGQLDERVRRARPAEPDAAAAGQPTYPGNQGGTNWYSPSFSPRTGLFYVSAWEDYASIYGAERRSSTRKDATSPAAARGTFGRCRARRASAAAPDQHLDRGGRSRRGDRARSRERVSRSGSST